MSELKRTLEGFTHCWVCGQLLPYAGTGRRRRVHDGWCKQENRSLLDARKSKEWLRANHARWRSRPENKAKTAAWSSRWHKANPEASRAHVARRKVKSLAPLDAMDRELSVAYRKAIRNDPCFYCGAVDAQHVDHYVSIANGGTDHWWNLVRACSACNRRKWSMNGDEFMLLIGVAA